MEKQARQNVLVVAFFFSLVVITVAAKATAKHRVAVLDFRNSGVVTDQEADEITDIVRSAARAVLPVSSFLIMTKENIYELLPPERELADCIGECAIETGREIGADFVVTGEIRLFGGQPRVAFELYNMRDGNLLNDGRVSGRNVLEIEEPLMSESRLLLGVLRLGGGEQPRGDGLPIGAETQEWDFERTVRHVVDFATNPTGAAVQVDGHYRCTTPCSKELSAGTHTITMSLPRYEQHEHIISVSEPMTVNHGFIPLFGWISVTTVPTGLGVWLDDTKIGLTPVVRHEADPGRHTILVRDDRYHDTGQQGFRLAGNQHREFHFIPNTRLGGISVKTITADSSGNALARDVEIDGESVGTTPWSDRIIVGIHRVMVGGEIREVTVAEHEVQELVFELSPESNVVAGAVGLLGGRDSIGLTMIRIEPGTFTMGSPSKERGRDNDEQQHRVTLSKAFFLSSTEVTQAQWQEVMDKKPSNFEGAHRPVERVSWLDCVEFCNKLSKQEGRSPAYKINGGTVTWNRDANGYRLPTEAEWEYACRAGSSTRYCNGNSENHLNAVGWYCGNSEEETHVVGGKHPNAWGLYDMHGNVWEWCWDRYGDYPSEPAKNPTVPSSHGLNVLRGGSWFEADGDRHCRSAFRYRGILSSREHNIGFRLARGP